MKAARSQGVRARIADEIYTCCAFWIAVSTLPALALSYVGKLFYVFDYERRMFCLHLLLI